MLSSSAHKRNRRRTPATPSAVGSRQSGQCWISMRAQRQQTAHNGVPSGLGETRLAQQHLCRNGRQAALKHYMTVKALPKHPTKHPTCEALKICSSSLKGTGVTFHISICLEPAQVPPVLSASVTLCSGTSCSCAAAASAGSGSSSKDWKVMAGLCRPSSSSEATLC